VQGVADRTVRGPEHNCTHQSWEDSLGMNERATSRKLVAIMFTDIVAYTSLVQSNEERALKLLERHNRLLLPFFPKHNGREVNRIGDSFLVEFSSALEAIRCAFEIQSFLHHHILSAGSESKIRLRIGIHLGDVVQKGKDILGDAVNIASRIEPLADPEGICVSGPVFDQVHNKFNRPMVELERVALKNVKSHVAVYKVIMPWEKSGTIQEAQELDKLHVAVLPFSNLSPDAGDAYFADGITEELIYRISLVRELKVISKTSVMTYKDLRTKRALDIGRELKVGTLLEGSVRKSGDRVRITAQLIDVASDTHLWSENYDRNLADVFAIQSEVASKVASSLKVRLLSKDRERIRAEPTLSMEAHTLYLKGLLHYNRHNVESYLTAIRLFSKAVEIDPSFALAFAKLAACYALLGFQALSADEDTYSKAGASAQKALNIDESLPEAHMALAFVLIDKWDISGAEREFLRAIEINPNFAAAHIYYAQVLCFGRRFDECIKEVQSALELDPLSAETCHWAGTALLYSGRYEEALEQFQNALEIDPNLTMARDNLALAYLQSGRIVEGLSELQRAVQSAGEIGFTQFANDLGYAYCKAGKPEEAKEILSKLLAMLEKNHSVSQLAIPVAGLYASLGEKEKALDWLEQAYAEHSPFLIVINSDLIYDSLRNDPRFVSLVRKIGF
jgi:adenylate cyclase